MLHSPQQRFQTVAYAYRVSVFDHLIEHRCPHINFGTFQAAMQKEDKCHTALCNPVLFTCISIHLKIVNKSYFVFIYK